MAFFLTNTKTICVGMLSIGLTGVFIWWIFSLPPSTTLPAFVNAPNVRSWDSECILVIPPTLVHNLEFLMSISKNKGVCWKSHMWLLLILWYVLRLIYEMTRGCCYYYDYHICFWWFSMPSCWEPKVEIRDMTKVVLINQFCGMS